MTDTSLADFLQRSSIVSATGASPTFAAEVAAARQVPWSSKVFVHPVDGVTEIPRYDSNNDTLNLLDSIDNAAHEIYHMTHQHLQVLYASPDPVSEAQYISAEKWIEVGSFIYEAKVQNELAQNPVYSLTHPTEPDVIVTYVNASAKFVAFNISQALRDNPGDETAVARQLEVVLSNPIVDGKWVGNQFTPTKIVDGLFVTQNYQAM